MARTPRNPQRRPPSPRAGGPRPRVRSGMRMEPVYVKRRQRGVAVLVTSILLIIGAVIYIAVVRANPPSLQDFEGTGDGHVELVRIDEGETVSQLGPELVERGIVKSNGAFQRAANSNPKASNAQPGTYRLQRNMSAKAAIDALVDPASRVEELEIPGGATLEDINTVNGQKRPGIFSEISRISCSVKKDKCISVEELERVAGTTPPQELGVPAWAVKDVEARGDDPRRLEGLIAPGTYMLNPEHSATEVLRDLVTRSAQTYNDSGIEGQAKAVNVSPYQLLVAASLVEREAPAGDFDKVARVILNRLARPMRLEFDSTVNYDVANVEVATSDEDRARETPWNTYVIHGLPATPIAAPSAQSLNAMEHPADGSWLYFVTVDKDGTTVFNDTFEEHQQATQRAIERGVLDSARDEKSAPALQPAPAPAPAPEQ